MVFDADGGPGRGTHARDLAVLDDVHTVRSGGPRVAPGDGIVTHRSAAALQQTAHDLEAARLGRRELGREFEHRGPIEKLGVDAGEPHGIAAPGEIDHVVVRQRKVEHAARAVHHVVIEDLRQPLPAPQRVFVEVVVLRQQVVRADDGGVAPDIAVTHQTLLEHRDVLDSMIVRQMIGGREPMAAGADHHDVVRRFEFGAAPQGPPKSGAGEARSQQRPS